MGTDNNPKTIPDTGEMDNKAVGKPADTNAPLSLKEAEAILEAPEGEIEEAIEKQKLSKDTEIAPDLKELKKEQDQKKKEVKEKKAEVKEATKTEKEKAKAVEPSKFEGKTPEERLKIYLEMEKSHTKLSQEKKELEQKVADLAEVDKKIEEMEKQSVISKQKATPVKLPPYPTKELYYEDPDKYNQQVKEYYDAKINAMVSPLYGQNWSSQKDKAINNLKDNTKDDIVPYKEVEKEVESRVRKNPAIVNQYGLNAREYFYNQIRNETLPQKIADIKTTALEEAKRELQEEKQEMSESQVMSSDITTKAREGKPIDFEQQLKEEDDPEKVIQGLKRKYKITRDI